MSWGIPERTNKVRAGLLKYPITSEIKGREGLLVPGSLGHTDYTRSHKDLMNRKQCLKKINL